MGPYSKGPTPHNRSQKSLGEASIIGLPRRHSGDQRYKNLGDVEYHLGKLKTARSSGRLNSLFIEEGKYFDVFRQMLVAKGELGKFSDLIQLACCEHSLGLVNPLPVVEQGDSLEAGHGQHFGTGAGQLS